MRTTRSAGPFAVVAFAGLVGSLLLPGVSRAAYDLEVVPGDGLTNNTGAPSFLPTGDDSQVGADLIVAQLDSGTDVLLDTGVAGGQPGTLTIHAAIVKTVANPSALTLLSQDVVRVNQPIDLPSGALSVPGPAAVSADVTTGGAQTWSGTLEVLGSRTFSASDAVFAAAVTGTGDLLLRAYGAVELHSPSTMAIALGIHGGAGIVMDNSAVTVPLTVTADISHVGNGAGDNWFAPGGSLTYSSFRPIELIGGSEQDTFIISPGAGTIRIFGGAPTDEVGDTLVYTTTSSFSPRIERTGKGAGIWDTRIDDATVFEGIETTTVATGTVSDIPVAGFSLIALDKTVSTGRAFVRFVAKDDAVTKGLPSDVVSIAGMVHVAWSGVSGEFDLHARRWTENDPEGARYWNREAPDTASVRSATVKEAATFKMAARSLGDDALDLSVAPAGPVYVAASIVNFGDTRRLCAKFESCEHEVLGDGTSLRLVCKNGTGDPDCLATDPAKL